METLGVQQKTGTDPEKWAASAQDIKSAVATALSMKLNWK